MSRTPRSAHTRGGISASVLEKQDHVNGLGVGHSRRRSTTSRVHGWPGHSVVSVGLRAAWLGASSTILLSLLGGCAVHLQGMVEPAAGGPRLFTAEGDRYKLVLIGEAQPLAHLDGHFVSIDGTRVFGAVTVGDWKVIEGVHGMSVWVGPVAAMGSQLGIEDRNSGGFYWLHGEAVGELRRHTGELVLVEGYVDGPHEVQVLYFTLLEP